MKLIDKIDKILIEGGKKEEENRLQKEIDALKQGKLTSIGKRRLKALEDMLFMKKLGK